MMTISFWQRFLLLVAVPALIHSVPEARAFQRNTNSRQGSPRPSTTRQQQQQQFGLSQHQQQQQHQLRPSPFSTSTATSQRTLKRSSSSLRSTIAIPVLTKEQQGHDQTRGGQLLQDDAVINETRLQQQSNALFTTITTTIPSIPMDRLVWSATSLVFVGAAYSLTKTGLLSSILRYTTLCVQNIFFAYQRALISKPLSTKVATGAVLAMLGDALAQSTSSSSSSSGFSYDKRRALSFAAFDSCYRIFQHYMFPAVIALCQGNILKMVVPSVLVPMTSALERTLLYQLVIVPCVYYPVFFAFTGSIQGLSPKESLARARSYFFQCWRRNLMFWIPIQMVLFGLISESWQIPFACLMGVLWGAILSLTAGKTTKA